MLAIFGLGSNVEPRGEYLRRALAALTQHFGALTRSGVYESRAVLPPGAPREWDAPYLNMAAAAQVDARPLAVLARVKAIEAELGRAARGHWGPREIDIDLLALGDTVLSAPELTLPHAELLKRDFALLPLAEIAPDWRHPATGRTARELVSALEYAPHAGLRAI